MTAWLNGFDLAALTKRFGHVPIECIDNREPFPQSLRLVISSHCGQRCQYPDEHILWCHNEGIVRNGLEAPQVDSLLAIVRFFRDRYGIRRVKIGGLEPVVGPHLFRLLESMRPLGIDDVSLTTHGLRLNGRLQELRQAGLTRMTISIQHFEPETYRRITGRDGLANALALVEEAQAANLEPIKINRVLLRHHTDDIAAFLEWVRARGLTARLFDLLWQPQHDPWYLKYLVPWQEFIPMFENQVERLIVQHYALSQRTHVLFKLHGGGGIEVNLMQPKRLAAARVCQSCPFADVCGEGYLGCGIRIAPDLRLSPCVLRGDLSQDIQPLFQGESIPDQIDNVLRGL